MDEDFQWAISEILNKVTPSFYGSATITFQAGKVQFVETKETKKPPS